MGVSVGVSVGGTGVMTTVGAGAIVTTTAVGSTVLDGVACVAAEGRTVGVGAALDGFAIFES